MRWLWVFVFITSLLFSAQKSSSLKGLWDKIPNSTEAKIKSIKSSLNKNNRVQKQMNVHLSEIAKSIMKAEKENLSLEKELKKLGKNKEVNEKKYKIAKKKIDALGEKIKSLDSTIKSQNIHFVNLLTNQFSLIMAMNTIDKPTVESIVMKEIYETYKEQNKQALNTLKDKINTSIKKKKVVIEYQKKIEKSISKISKKREAYIKKKAQKDKLLKKLSDDERKYRKSIKELINRQNLIRSTLAKLNIIRKEEISEARAREKARQEEIDRRAAARSQARSEQTEGHISAKSFNSTQQVKQVGSSYHKNKLYRYRGAKTISPLKGSRVVKSFGTYIDPIYKMKIFNESVTLKAPKQNAKVRNVLNGKVIFSGQNSMLGKVIVIAHGNKLHTVYAGLSKISPMIKTGSRVKKGTVIGKVKRKLIFEATKDSKYINPLRLISI